MRKTAILVVSILGLSSGLIIYLNIRLSPAIDEVRYIESRLGSLEERIETASKEIQALSKVISRIDSLNIDSSVIRGNSARPASQTSVISRSSQMSSNAQTSFLSDTITFDQADFYFTRNGELFNPYQEEIDKNDIIFILYKNDSTSRIKIETTLVVNGAGRGTTGSFNRVPTDGMKSNLKGGELLNVHIRSILLNEREVQMGEPINYRLTFR